MRNYRFSSLQKSATLYLIIVTVLVYTLQAFSEIIFRTDLLMFFGSKINQFILQGQVWRLITPVFLHGSILHIVFNMYALYTIGPRMEERYGTWPFLTLYLVSALWGNTVSFLLTQNASLGASTAIFGLIAAQGVFIYKNRLMLGSAARPMMMNIIMIVAVNLMLGLSPGVDNWGHIGGLLGGLFFSWFASPTYGVTEGLFGSNVVVSREKRITLITIASILIAVVLILIKFFLN